MMNTTNYPPLKWPDEHLKKASVYSFNLKAGRAFKEMQKIVDERGPIPPELWGDDPRRRETAQKLSRIIKDNVGWSADNFIPDDPFDLLCWGGGYDLQEVGIFLDIEKHFVIDIPDEHIEMICKFTLGQLVDYLLANAACPVSWPAEGKVGLESRICPTAAAFYDLKNFIREHCINQNIDFRPSTMLTGLLDDKETILLKNYICERFGVKPIARKRFLGFLPPFKTWLILNFIMALVIHLWLPSLEWHNIFILMLPILFVLGIIVGQLSFLTWRRGLFNIRDLIKWIVDQRASTHLVKMLEEPSI
jgi:hypothetical protein